MPNYVPGIGPLEPKLMIVGEAPGKYEDEQQVPFVGPTGDLLNTALFKAGINRHECYITNVSKYRPPLNNFDMLHTIGVDLNEQIKELWENEIKKLNPNCILAVGDRALQALTGLSGITNYRGSILTAIDARTKVVPTIHPAALFPKYEDGRKMYGNEDSESSGALPWTWLKLIEHDIARAGEESLTRELNLPARDLMIAQNSLDVFRFFREYEKLDIAVNDIESINCVPVCTGFAFNKYHALSIPLLKKIGNIELTDMGMNELAECWRIIFKELMRLKLIGHNYNYDDFKQSLIGMRIPNVYSDTLIKTRVIFPELPVKKLHVITSIWTREPYYKEEGKEFRIGKDKIERLFKYNGKDCAVNFEVDAAQEEDLISLGETYNIPLKEYYYDYQMKKHKFYLAMGQNGFRVDIARQEELQKRYTEMQSVVHKRLVDEIGQEINVKSPPQKKKLLYDIMKFRYMKRAPTSEETIVSLINNHCKGMKTKYKPILEDILEESRIRDQKSRYINFRRDYDDRCKTIFNVIATETTRTSTGILKVPFRPKKEKIGLSFHTIAQHGRLAKDIRSMFICDEGMVMIKADSSQAEPRVVAVLCQDWELLKAFDEKVDIHRRTAGLLMQWSNKLELGADYKNELIDSLEKDGPERFTGKKVRNAGNYDMGKHELMIQFNTDAQKFDIKASISEWKAGQMLDMFHSASPKIREIFHTEIKDAIDSTKVLIDPFGGIRIFNGKLEPATYREGYANIPQRTVGHIVQGAALKIEDELNDSSFVRMSQDKLWHNIITGKKLPYMWLSEDHDCLTIQVPEKDWEAYAKIMRKHLEQTVDFSTYCTLKRDYKLTIPSDIQVSNTNYGAFQKVKVA